MAGTFASGLRPAAWDGTVLDVPDTPRTAAEFGFTRKGGVNQSGNPQMRLMALIDAAFDSVSKFSAPQGHLVRIIEYALTIHPRRGPGAQPRPHPS
ncbi:hypothetical protein ACODT5_39975 [Streptomyces sp. 5.8]|uniref:hypothetical protein n=1 Tax=Streptomyces sp. 5.8 TaxID=3406571 RepID=UPI003BB690DA